MPKNFKSRYIIIQDSFDSEVFKFEIFCFDKKRGINLAIYFDPNVGNKFN